MNPSTFYFPFLKHPFQFLSSGFRDWSSYATSAFRDVKNYPTFRTNITVAIFGVMVGMFWQPFRAKSR